MKFLSILTTLLSISFVSAIPPSQDYSISLRHESSQLDTRDLEKRRGGGGGKGGGSSGGGRGGSSGGGRPVSSYSFSGGSNTGGRTRDGSGSPPGYGGRYGGGAVVPYTAGQRSPTRSVAPFLLPIAAIGFFPGIWLYSAYAYPYGYGYGWRDGARNRTANVTCLCQEYSVCGCDDDPNNQTSRDALARQLTGGSATGAPINSSTVRVIEHSPNNITAYINGTLENGTTAAGGTDPSNENQISAATALLVNYGGYWVAALVATMFITVA